MSRLTQVAIPFVGGFNDGISAKLLPNGVLADVRNGRLHAAGSLRLRRGWRPVTMSEVVSGTALTALDLYTYQNSLVALIERVSSVGDSLALATLVESNASRPWVQYTSTAIPPTTQVRRVGQFPPLSGAIERASAAVTSDGVYGCVLAQSSTQSVFHVFEMDSGETIAYGSLANGSRVRKVVSLGSTFGLIENTGAALVLFSLNPTGTNPTFTSVATLVTAAVTQFDAFTAFDATPTLLHIGDVVGAAASYRQFSLAGVQNGVAKTVAAANVQAVALCSDDSTVQFVHQETLGTSGEIFLTTFSATSPFTTSQGPTAVNAGQVVVAAGFAVGETNGQVYVGSEHANGLGTPEGSCSINRINAGVHATNNRSQHLSRQLVSGFLTRDFSSAAGLSSSTGLLSSNRTSYYSDTTSSPWFMVDVGLGAQPVVGVAPWAPGMAPTGDALVVMPRSEGDTPRMLSVRSVKVRSTERRPGAQLGNALYITGGMLTQWTGGLAENGMLAPVVFSAVASNGAGTIANGDYSYRAVMVWRDEDDRVHRSPVSGTLNVTLSGANDTVTVTVHAPKTLRRDGNLVSNPFLELYRTEAGPGELFYRVGVTAVDTTNDATVFTDVTPDADILDQPQLYTQGEFGATSGILEMAIPQPSAFIAGTKRRLILGSADTTYQWSQVTLPEVPVFFADPGVSGDPAQAYLDEVEGRVSGVAALDELVFIGTRERIWVTGGTGPNLAGIGEFSPPTRLPVDVGFFNAHSILETSEGLWFLGTAEAMYRLPRGSATPIVDHSVQDHLSTIVGCGYESKDNTAVWAQSNARTLVRQMESGQWFGDALPFTPIAMHGHNGVLYAIASNGVVWRYDTTAFGDGASGATSVALQVTTGDVEPMQLAGHGRIATVEVDLEVQTQADVLCEVSYDSGLNWSSLGAHTVTGAAGSLAQRQWFLTSQRVSRARFRFTMTPASSTAEGCRLTGCMVYLVKRSGQTRLAGSNRR